MELTFHTSTSRLSALAFELIDGSPNHRLIGEKRADEVSDLIGEIAERLAKLRELLSLSSLLYAHFHISIQFVGKKSNQK